jgi:hypothetical protein
MKEKVTEIEALFALSIAPDLSHPFVPGYRLKNIQDDQYDHP